MSVLCYRFRSVSYPIQHYVLKIPQCCLVSSMCTFATFYYPSPSDGHPGYSYTHLPPPQSMLQWTSLHHLLLDSSENFFGLCARKQSCRYVTCLRTGRLPSWMARPVHTCICMSSSTPWHYPAAWCLPGCLLVLIWVSWVTTQVSLPFL